MLHRIFQTPEIQYTYKHCVDLQHLADTHGKCWLSHVAIDLVCWQTIFTWTSLCPAQYLEPFILSPIMRRECSNGRSIGSDALCLCTDLGRNHRGYCQTVIAVPSRNTMVPCSTFGRKCSNKSWQSIDHKLSIHSNDIFKQVTRAQPRK